MSLDGVRILPSRVIGGERVLFVPRKAGKLQNSFVSFRSYSRDAILLMSLLRLFSVMFPEEYLE